MYELQNFRKLDELLVTLLIMNQTLVLLAKKGRDLNRSYITITLVVFKQWEQNLDLEIWS